MAIMITADVPGQTLQGYEGMLQGLSPSLKSTPGFIMHTAYPIEGGWHVIEVWESSEAAAQYFAKYIAPNLPPGIKPKRTVHELHSIVKP
jgi:hypothetical protein